VEIEMKLVKHMFAAENNWYARHIMKWLTAPEIVSWINGISAQGYSSEVEELLKTAKPAISVERWQTISENVLGERA
jgi:hypothetical protein